MERSIRQPQLAQQGLELPTCPVGKVQRFSVAGSENEVVRIGILGVEAHVEKEFPQPRRKWNRLVAGFALEPTDAQLLAGDESFKLPTFTLLGHHIGRNRLLPVIEIRIREAEDLFSWLFIRAIANSQLSRFAHCIVCGRWELKKIAGQRTKKIFDFAKRIFGSSRRDCPPAYLEMPMWPAVCSRSACKVKFHNVIRGRAAFHREQFRGLREGR